LTVSVCGHGGVVKRGFAEGGYEFKTTTNASWQVMGRRETGQGDGLDVGQAKRGAHTNSRIIPIIIDWAKEVAVRCEVED